MLPGANKQWGLDDACSDAEHSVLQHQVGFHSLVSSSFDNVC